MAFAAGSTGGRPMADINTTPLVDVMLVLLIIFMITAPLVAHKTRFTVPIRSTEQKPPGPDPVIVTFHVRATGSGTALYLWNDDPIDLTAAQVRMREYSRRDPQPEFNIKSDAAVPYQAVALVLAAARREGFEKVTFNDLRAQPL